MNVVNQIGNICQDPVLRVTPSNKPVCSFSIAINESYVNKDGERVETVSFIPCEAWGPVAENIHKFFKKGNKIGIEGSLKQEKWSDATTGQQREKLKVTVRTFHFCESKKDRGGDDGGRW